MRRSLCNIGQRATPCHAGFAPPVEFLQISCSGRRVARRKILIVQHYVEQRSSLDVTTGISSRPNPDLQSEPFCTVVQKRMGHSRDISREPFARQTRRPTHILEAEACPDRWFAGHLRPCLISRNPSRVAARWKAPSLGRPQRLSARGEMKCVARIY